MAESTCVELTPSGAKGTDYTAGQRLILPTLTAAYFIRNGWALDLDDDDTEATSP